MNIDDTLSERGGRYGNFMEQAGVSQKLLYAMRQTPNWDHLDVDMAEALQLSCVKIARILSGDPYYHDNWHDLVGYFKLVADRLAPRPLTIVDIYPTKVIDDE